jgi:hypothetical protein
MSVETGPMAKLDALKEFLVECAIEKVYQSEMLDQVVDATVQIYGGYGFTTEYPAERYYRDARIARIYEGTNEINRLVIAGTVLKRAALGRLPLVAEAMATAEAALAGRLEPPTSSAPLAAMEQRLWQAKRLFYLVIAAFVQGMGPRITDPEAVGHEQECLGWIADVIMEIYAIESTLCRVRKSMADGGNDAAALPMALLDYHADGACRRITARAQDVIATIAPDDMADGLLRAAAAISPYQPINLRDTGRQIAAAVIDKDGQLVV